MMTGEHVDLLEALRQPVFVPEGVPATAALEAFKRSSMQVALVIDERGNCKGLLTPTDILEALVGEVPDSHNPAKAPPIVHRADGSWLVDGLLAAEELKVRLGLRELPNEAQGGYQTVGGLVMDQRTSSGAYLWRATASGGAGSPSRYSTWRATASTRCS